MKAKICPARSHEFDVKVENMKQSKDTSFENTEMQECFLKLKELVPGLQAQDDKKLSKVQVLQGVIDYILELELTLDFDPFEAARNLYKHQFQQERKPLAEYSSNMVSVNNFSLHHQLSLLGSSAMCRLHTAIIIQKSSIVFVSIYV